MPLVAVALVLAVALVYLVYTIQVQSVQVQATRQAEAVVAQTLALPPTTIHLISDRLNEQGLYRIDFISPWPINPDHAPRSAWERDAIAALLDDPQRKLTRREVIDDENHLLYASAAFASSVTCVSCHNDNPDSPRRDFEPGDLMGAMVVEIHLADALATARVQAVGTSLLVLAALACFVGFVLLFQRRAIIQPVEQLAQAAQKMAQGDLAVELEVKSEDEIGYMTRSFNQMAGQLRALYEELQHSEEHFRSLSENASDVISILDGDGAIRYSSPSVERVLGYKPHDLDGHSLFDFTHPGDAPNVVNAFTNITQNPGVTAPLEFRVRHKDGSWRILEVIANNLLDDPAVAGVVVNSRDVTERVQAESQRDATLEALRESEERFRSLSAATFEGITFTEQGIFVDTNQQFADMFGYDVSDLPGMDARELVAPEDWELVRSNILSGREVPYEHRAVRKDGAMIFVQVRPRMTSIKGRPVRVTAVRDITERVRAEEALQESERRYRQLIENVPTVAWVTSQRGKPVFISSNVERVYGYSSDEIIQAGQALWFDRIHREDKGRVRDAFEKLFSETRPFDVEYRIQREDGQWIWLYDRANTVEEIRGNFYAYGAFLDITAHKHAESQRDATLEALHLYTERLRVLHEIDQGILAAQSPEAIAQTTLAYLRQILPCRRSGITLFDFTTNEGVALAVDVSGETQMGPGARQSLDPFEAMIKEARQGKIIFIEQAQAKEKISSFLYSEGARSGIHVPLILQGELIGSLDLWEATPGAFLPEHIDIARQVADQLAIAIQQARLHEQVQRHAEELEGRVADRTRELSALHEVSAVASEPLDMQTTLARSLERVLEAMRSDAGVIHLLEEGEDALRLAAQQGIPPDLVPQIETLPSQGLGEWVVEHNEPLIVPYVASDPRMAVQTTQPRSYVGVPMRASGQVVGVLGVIRDATQPQFSAEEVALLTSVADQAGAVVESARLRQLAEQAAVMEERQRLARDLHDSVTQSLYSTTLLAETGRQAIVARDLGTAENCLERLGGVTQQALKEMRLLVYELRPPVLEKEGLLGALQQRLDAVEARAGIEARLLVEGEIKLAASQEDALYRIALEALNNALKHAEATIVRMHIQADDDIVWLEVADNGRGFDPEASDDTGGMGLVTMRERAEQIGGALSIVSSPGQGTKIKVTLENGVEVSQ